MSNPWSVKVGGHYAKLVWLFLLAHRDKRTTLEDIVAATEVTVYFVRMALERLQERGALVIDRTKRPFQYHVVEPSEMPEIITDPDHPLYAANF